MSNIWTELLKLYTKPKSQNIYIKESINRILKVDQLDYVALKEKKKKRKISIFCWG